MLMVSCNFKMAVSPDHPFRRYQISKYNFEKSRLTRSIRADHGKDLAVGDGEGDIVDCQEPAEALADSLNGEERAHASSCGMPSRFFRAGQTPFGARVMITMRQRP